jgi:hypothetical protein
MSDQLFNIPNSFPFLLLGLINIYDVKKPLYPNIFYFKHNID